MSGPILVAASTAWSFNFNNYRSAVNVQVRFYTDAAGLVALSPRGTGTRDITASNVSSAYEGNPARPTTIDREIESGIDNGAFPAAVDGTWYDLSLGGGLGQVTLTAAPNATPGTAVSYRLFVDAVGSSALA